MKTKLSREQMVELRRAIDVATAACRFMPHDYAEAFEVESAH
jgi:hypothetical protein